MINAVAYARFSTDMQREESIEANFDIDKLNSNDKLSIKNLLNKYINKIIVDYPNLEIHFKFSSNIDNAVKQAKKNERVNSSVYLAPLVGLEPTTYRLTAERSTN